MKMIDESLELYNKTPRTLSQTGYVEG